MTPKKPADARAELVRKFAIKLFDRGRGGDKLAADYRHAVQGGL
jgi:hypothetical protein